MYKGKRFAALFMSMALATSMLPTNVLAADTADLVLEEQERESQDTMPADPSVTYQDGTMTVTWNTVGIADSYDVYRAESRYGTYTKIATVDGETTYEDTEPNADKYANYYKIAVKEKFEMSAPASLEISMFGKDVRDHGRKTGRFQTGKTGTTAAATADHGTAGSFR